MNWGPQKNPALQWENNCHVLRTYFQRIHSYSAQGQDSNDIEIFLLKFYATENTSFWSPFLGS